MDKNKNNNGGQHESPLPGQISDRDRRQAADAHQAADRDMENDAELTAHSPNDDLDEGETARLGEDNTGLI